MGKNRRKFSQEFKEQVVEDFISGHKTVAELAAEHGISSVQIYKWKADLNARERSQQFHELVESGFTQAQAKRFQQMEDELLEYKRMLAQKTLEVDLLKKLDPSKTSLTESELNGLIETIRRLDRKRGRVR